MLNNTSSFKFKLGEMNLLVFCLLLPPTFDFLRKFWPGQPIFFTVIGFPILFFFALFTLKTFPILPRWAKIPVLLWFGWQTGFLLLSLQYGWELFVVSFMTHMVPLVLPWIAYRSILSGCELKILYSFYGGLALLLLPFAFVSVMYGDVALPHFLRAIDTLIELSRNYRSGIQAFSGIFSTQAGLANAMIGVTYIIVFTIICRLQKKQSIVWGIFSLSASLLLLYFSTRRGALFLSLPAIGFLFFNINSIRIKVASILMVSALGLIIKSVDIFTKSSEIAARSLMLSRFSLAERFNNVFIDLWANTILFAPFGTALGAGSKEGGIVGIVLPYPIEVGAAQVTHETGLFGALLLCSCMFFLIWNEWRVTSEMAFWKQPSRVLIVFQFLFFIFWFSKEMLAMGNYNFSYLLFWSVPGIIAGFASREKCTLSPSN